jgi:hypothetical protein
VQTSQPPAQRVPGDRIALERAEGFFHGVASYSSMGNGNELGHPKNAHMRVHT